MKNSKLTKKALYLERMLMGQASASYMREGSLKLFQQGDSADLTTIQDSGVDIVPFNGVNGVPEFLDDKEICFWLNGLQWAIVPIVHTTKFVWARVQGSNIIPLSTWDRQNQFDNSLFESIVSSAILRTFP